MNEETKTLAKEIFRGLMRLHNDPATKEGIQSRFDARGGYYDMLENCARYAIEQASAFTSAWDEVIKNKVTT